MAASRIAALCASELLLLLYLRCFGGEPILEANTSATTPYYFLISRSVVSVEILFGHGQLVITIYERPNDVSESAVTTELADPDPHLGESCCLQRATRK